MVTSSIGENPGNTHQAVLFHLKRKNELTVADLCKLLGITSMAVRRHLVGLQKEGLVECRLVRQSRGRPTYKYRLTAKGESLFPSALSNLAFELLDAVYDARGHEGVMELLTLRQEALLKKLLPKLENLDLEARVSAVSRFFFENGYMAEWSKLPSGDFFIYQQHCAVHSLASEFKQICVLEGRLMEKLLGVRVTREQYMMRGDPVCGYMIHASGAESRDQAAPEIRTAR